MAAFSADDIDADSPDARFLKAVQAGRKFGEKRCHLAYTKCPHGLDDLRKV